MYPVCTISGSPLTTTSSRSILPTTQPIGSAPESLGTARIHSSGNRCRKYRYVKTFFWNRTTGRKESIAWDIKWTECEKESRDACNFCFLQEKATYSSMAPTNLVAPVSLHGSAVTRLCSLETQSPPQGGSNQLLAGWMKTPHCSWCACFVFCSTFLHSAVSHHATLHYIYSLFDCSFFLFARPSHHRVVLQVEYNKANSIPVLVRIYTVQYIRNTVPGSIQFNNVRTWYQVLRSTKSKIGGWLYRSGFTVRQVFGGNDPWSPSTQTQTQHQRHYSSVRRLSSVFTSNRVHIITYSWSWPQRK